MTCAHTTFSGNSGIPVPSSKDPLRPVCAWCGEDYDGGPAVTAILQREYDRRPQPWDWR